MSRLSDQGAILSTQQTVKNRYKQGNEYNVGNKDAISDGDNFGRGANASGEVGTADDLKARKTQLTKNKYKEGNEYNLNNA